VGPDFGLYAGTTMANPAYYAAAKGGVIQLTRYWATTMAPTIRVNGVAPGGIERGQPDSFRQRYAARTPMGRMATEADIVGGVVYFASDLSRYVTGQVLAIDGGWTAW
jgi:NAD(P)-dependent dehydrogenase (short-subunit alcohol dehydrogenase family)